MKATAQTFTDATSEISRVTRSSAHHKRLTQKTKELRDEKHSQITNRRKTMTYCTNKQTNKLIIWSLKKESLHLKILTCFSSFSAALHHYTNTLERAEDCGNVLACGFWCINQFIWKSGSCGCGINSTFILLLTYFSSRCLMSDATCLQETSLCCSGMFVHIVHINVLILTTAIKTQL